MYKLPAAGPSLLIHLLVLVAALLAWPLAKAWGRITRD